MSSKTASFNRDGAAGRRYAPGGWAGWTSSFVIGGSSWDAARPISQPADARAWSQAGFTVASIGAQGETSTETGETSTALSLAAQYGLFLLPPAQPPRPSPPHARP